VVRIYKSYQNVFGELIFLEGVKASNHSHIGITFLEGILMIVNHRWRQKGEINI
jgi:hypothetical protein